MLKKTRKAARFVCNLAIALSLLLPSFSYIAIQNAKEAKAVTVITVDSAAEFANGTQDGNLVLGEETRLDTLAPGVVHDLDDDFNQPGSRNWEAEATGDQVRLENTGIATYNPTSILPINVYYNGGSPNFYNNFYDPATGLLYAPASSTTDDSGGGLNVINTQGTIETSDDVLLARYKSFGSIGTSVALPRNQVYKVEFEGDYMFVVMPGDGISVINTQGTFLDPSDDVLEFTYTTGTSPALTHAFSYDIAIDSANSIMYVAGFGGIDVIDIGADPGSILDDSGLGTLASGVSTAIELSGDHVYADGGTGLEVYARNGAPAVPGGYTNISYTTGSSPAILSNSVRSVEVEPGFMYVETFSGISVIDMGGDGEPGGGDDTVATTYNSGNLLPFDDVWDSAIDVGNRQLYVAQRDGGLSIIDFGFDSAPGGGDDLLVNTYDELSTPALDDPWVNDVTLASNGWVVASGASASMIIDPGAVTTDYKPSGTFVGPPLEVSDTPTGVISWSESAAGDETVETQTRAGDASVFFFDDHDDAVLPTIVFNEFPGAVESGTTLSFTDSTSCFGFCAVDWQANAIPDFYSENSTVSMRVRYTSGTGSETPLVTIRTDQAESTGGGTTLTSGVWETISMSPTAAFSEVGIQTQPTGESGHVDDQFEIDWVKIDVHDASWGPWSGAYTDENGEFITTDTTGMTWIQYRVDQTTANPGSTPTVDFVELSNFQATGQYTSEVFDAGSTADWQDLTEVATLPTDTSITFYSRTGDTAVPDGSWSAWQLVNSPIDSPDARYMQFRADFATSNPAKTPQLDSVAITYDAAAAPPGPNDANSSIAASPNTIDADGAATSTVTVTVRDEFTTPLPGETVVINTTAGTLSSVTDNGDGSYSATLTASNTAETATLSFTVNALPFSDTAQVTFEAIPDPDPVPDPGDPTDTATIDPPTKVSENSLTVTITPNQGGSSPITTIRYTDDGSEVTASAKVYTSPFAITEKGTTTIKWKAYNSDGEVLDQGQENYYLPDTHITPTCHYPDTKQCYGPQTFEFTTAESDEEILYTINNTDPTTDQPVAIEPEITVEEFLAEALVLTENKTVTIGENTKIRFASRNRFGQLSSVYYRDSVLNFPHILTMPDPGANAHLLGFRHDGKRIVAPNFIIKEFAKNGGSMTMGDLNGDGRDEIILSPGKGKSSDLYVFSYHEEQQLGKDKTEQRELELLAFKKNVYNDENMKAGLNLAAADINGDGKDEVVTVPKEGGKSHVLVFKYNMEERENAPNRKFLEQTIDGNFYAFGGEGDYTNNYTAGTEIAAADLDGNGTSEIIAASNTGQIRVFDKKGKRWFTLGFHPYGKNARMPINITTADTNQDGEQEIIAVPKNGTAHVLFLNRYGQKVFTPNFVANVSKSQENRIAVADTDFDGKQEILLQDKASDGKPVIRIYDPEQQKAKGFAIQPNYPGYDGDLTFATGVWSGSR